MRDKSRLTDPHPDQRSSRTEDGGRDMYYYARLYRDHGFRVIPIRPREKAPAVRWKQYVNREPEEGEIRDWFLGKGPEETGIGVILGPSKLVVLDIEDRRWFPLFFDMPVEQLAKRTWICRTGKGYHIYYRYNGSQKADKIENVAEIRSGELICVLAESIHPNGAQYTWLSEIESLQIQYLDLRVLRRVKRRFKLLRGILQILPVGMSLYREGFRQDICLYLSGYLRKQGLDRSECRAIIRFICIQAQDEELDRRLKAVDDTYTKDLEEVAGYERLKETLTRISTGEEVQQFLDGLTALTEKGRRKKKKPPERDNRTDEEIIEDIIQHLNSTPTIHPGIDLIDDLLYMGIYLKDASQYLLISSESLIPARKEGGELIIRRAESRFVIGPQFWELSKNHFLRLSQLVNEVHRHGQINRETHTVGLQQVQELLRHYVWFDHEAIYTVVATWILGTYLFPIFQSYPILLLRGPREVGKSTLLSLLAQLCFNASPPETRYTEASLKRTAHHSRGTLLFDEQQYLTNRDRYGEVQALLEAGTEKGRIASLIDQDTGRRTVCEVYSPKALATRQTIGLEDKCIVIRMEEPPQGVRDEYEYNRSFLEEDERFDRVAVDLCAWALTHWKEIRERYRSLHPPSRLRGRAFQYWRPILAICSVAYPEHYDSVLEYGEMITESIRADIRTAELETVILRIVISQEFGAVSLKTLHNKVQEQMPDIQHWQTVRSALGNLGIIKSQYTGREGVMYYIDLERAITRAEQRGIDLTELRRGTDQPLPTTPPPLQDDEATPETADDHQETTTPGSATTGEGHPTPEGQGRTEDVEYVLVKFQYPIRTPFMGVDTRTYGPYVAGDQDQLPRQNAESLLKRGFVKIL